MTTHTQVVQLVQRLLQRRGRIATCPRSAPPTRSSTSAHAAQHRARLHQQLTEFYLPSAGVDLSVYGWGTDGESARNHLAAAEHKTVLYGSWYSFMHPGADVFQQFLATHG